MVDSRDLIEVSALELKVGDRDGALGAGRRIVTAPEAIAGGRVQFVMQWSNGRKDTARPAADRTFRIRRKVVGAGMAVRWRGRATTCRSAVEVVDTAHPDSPVKAEEVRGERWAMRCEHGTAVGRSTQRAALEDVHDPRLWCVRCVGVKAGELVLPLS